MKKDPVKYLVLAVKFQDYVAVNDNLKLFKLFHFNNVVYLVMSHVHCVALSFTPKNSLIHLGPVYMEVGDL